MSGGMRRRRSGADSGFPSVGDDATLPTGRCAGGVGWSGCWGQGACAARMAVDARLRSLAVGGPLVAACTVSNGRTRSR